MRRAAINKIASVLICLTLVTPAFGAPASPATAAAPPKRPSLSESLTGDAKADYDAARVYLGDKDWVSAYVKLSSAYDKSKDPRLLWNMAACQKELRKYAKVVPLVERYLKESGTTLTKEDRAEAEALLAAIRPGVSSLRIDVSEPDAEISVDDEVLGKSPLTDPVLVALGARVVHVKKEGFRDFAQTVNVGGEAMAVSAQLVKIVHQGHLLVKAGSGDAISIDGHVVGTGVYSDTLPSRSYVLRVTAPGMRPYQGDVVVSDNETREVPVTLDRAETKVVVPTWVWYTVAGVVIVTGIIVAAVVVKNNNDSLGEYKGPPGTIPPTNGVELSRHGLGFSF